MAPVFQEIDESLQVMRRNSVRYEPVCRDAHLAWWGEPEESAADEGLDPEATGEFPVSEADPAPRHLFALLLDISATGARVVVDWFPTDLRPLWFRLGGGSSSDWSEAVVVGLTTTPRGPHVLRLAFRTPCPIETLRKAICG